MGTPAGLPLLMEPHVSKCVIQEMFPSDKQQARSSEAGNVSQMTHLLTGSPLSSSRPGSLDAHLRRFNWSRVLSQLSCRGAEAPKCDAARRELPCYMKLRARKTWAAKTWEGPGGLDASNQTLPTVDMEFIACFRVRHNLEG